MPAEVQEPVLAGFHGIFTNLGALVPQALQILRPRSGDEFAVSAYL
jgi:hypothetical protein